MKSLVTQYNSVWKLFIFIINSTTDAFENFTMVILSSLLASGPNSPFYQSLIAPNIGSDYSPGVGWVYYTLFDFQFTIYWDDHSSLSSTTAIQMWIISYIFHIISLLAGDMNSVNKLTLFPMCCFIAQLVEHRTGIAEVTGLNPFEALIFSGFFFPIA